jgi:O-antigen/teichoic acid export membrane protein
MLNVFFLARTLGASQFGQYNYILSIASLYLIIQDGGYRTLIFREFTQSTASLQADKQFLLPIAQAHVIVTTVIAFLLLLFVQRFSLLAALFCFALVAISGFISAKLKGENRFEQEAWWQIQQRSFTAIAIILVVLFVSPTVEAIFWAWLIGMLMLLMLPIARSVIQKPLFRFNLVKGSLAFLTIDAATAIYFRSDMILLEQLGDDSSVVGNYAAAYRLLEGVILIMTPVAMIAFRYLRLKSDNKKAFLTLLFWLCVMMFGVAAIIFVVGYSLSDKLVPFLFGDEYVQASGLLNCLLLSLFFILPNYILTQAAIAANQEWFYAYLVIIIALMNIILNIWWIPIYGAMGAAWATIVSEGLLFFGLLLRNVRELIYE